jgi:hypothetical protein
MMAVFTITPLRDFDVRLDMKFYAILMRFTGKRPIAIVARQAWPSTAKPKAARTGSRLAPERAMNGQKGPLRIAFRRMATTQWAGLRAYQLGLQRIGASFVE